MKRLVTFAMLCCVPLCAQQAQPASSGTSATLTEKPKVVYQQKLFILKYADPQRVSALLSVFNPSMSANAEMHALAVTAPAETIQAIEEAIAKLDVPSAAPKDFDFTVYLVVGTEGDNIGIATLPKDLDSVVSQLRGTFAFKNYRLLDVLNMRSRAGQRVSTHSAGGSVQLGSAARTVSTDFGIQSATLSPDGSVIRLERMSCQSNVPFEESPGHYQNQNLSLNTDLDIKDGQKVVVGRMGMTNQQAMFVVITVKIVQ